MVYEDVDLSYRARLLGIRCWYAADAVVRHAGSGTLGVASPTAVFHGQRNLEWVWIKNTPLALLLRTLPAHVMYSLAGALFYIVNGRGSAAIRGKLSVLAGLPAVLRKRASIQGSARAGTSAIEPLLERRWWARKRLEKARTQNPEP
jgi:GT2 family glycosyltransferase